MRHDTTRHKMIPGIVTILQSAGMTQRNYNFDKVMQILGEKKNGEDLLSAWIRFQYQVFTSLPNFG